MEVSTGAALAALARQALTGLQVSVEAAKTNAEAEQAIVEMVAEVQEASADVTGARGRLVDLSV
jgi:hypothetical protein